MLTALVSVAIAAGYWGFQFVRHPQRRLYGLMVLAAAGLAVLGIYGNQTEESPPWLGVAGAIGIGGAACLLVVGPLLRGAARRFAATEQFAIAARLLDVAELLAPGSGVAEEKQLLVAMREIRDGHIEQTIDALTAAKERAPAEAKLAIDERIAMLYLAAYRWDDAIAHAEANLLSAAPPLESVPRGPAGLRRALGIAPPVWVELLGAYGYKGDLDQAARMLARLETVCAGRDDAAIWVHRGRMMFLALAGRVAAVEALVAPRAARHMSRSSRTYWYAVALDRHGDGRAAHAAYEKARSQSRGRPRQLIDRALERMPEAQMIEVPPLASELVARVEAEAPPAVAVSTPPAAPWATGALVASLVAWAVALAIAGGDSSDPGVLLRGGALVPELVARGQWWRLADAIFLHAGTLQLFVTTVALWLIGGPCERLFGAARTLAIAGLAALAGSILTYTAAPIAAGAPPFVFAGSGLVMGLLGAELVERLLNRRRPRVEWRRGTWGRLVLATVAVAGSALTDPAAGALGMAVSLGAGALAGAVLSPGAAWTRPIAAALGIAFVAVTASAAVVTARTSLVDSLGAPTHALVVGGIAVRAPAGWTGGDALEGPAGVEAHFEIAATDALAAKTREIADGLHKELGQVRIDTATEKLVVPAGWQGTELVASADTGDGTRQTWRCMIAQKPLAGGRMLVATLIAPEGMVHAAASLFTQIVASAAP